MDEPHGNESEYNYTGGDDPEIPPLNSLSTDHNHHPHQTQQNQNVGYDQASGSGDSQSPSEWIQKYIRFEKIGWDRAAELIFVAVVAFFAIFQYLSARSTSSQIQAIIDAATQIKGAAWTFSGSAYGINNAGWNAFGELKAQEKQMEAAREVTDRNAIKSLQTTVYEFDQQQRAWVGLTAPVLTPDTTLPQSEVNTPGIILMKIGGGIVNTGKSPAENVNAIAGYYQQRWDHVPTEADEKWMRKITSMYNSGKLNGIEAIFSSPHFSRVLGCHFAQGTRKGIGKAVFSWHNCVVET